MGREGEKMRKDGRGEEGRRGVGEGAEGMGREGTGVEGKGKERGERMGRERGPQFENKKLSYRRETARQLHTSFSAHSLIVHFTEHRICLQLYNR